MKKGVIRKLWEWLFGEPEIDHSGGLKDGMEALRKSLQVQADMASFAMVRADEAWEKLNAEIENHDALDRQAVEFMRQGNESAATRCVVLKLQSAKEVERLKEEYERLQKEAEARVADFRGGQDELKSREKELPVLAEDAQMLKMEEELRASVGVYSTAAAKEKFDEAAREIRMKRRQIENRQLLESDPNAEIDAKIRLALEEKEISRALADIRLKAQGPIEAEVVTEELEGVTEARKLLAAPRFRGLISSGLSSSQQDPVFTRKSKRRL